MLIIRFNTRCQVVTTLVLLVWRLSDVWRLSVAYIGPKSRRERPIGRLKLTQRYPTSHVTRIPFSRSEGQRSTCRGGAYCGGLPHSSLQMQCRDLAFLTNDEERVGGLTTAFQFARLNALQFPPYTRFVCDHTFFFLYALQCFWNPSRVERESI